VRPLKERVEDGVSYLFLNRKNDGLKGRFSGLESL
jgi:hypothetical protein